MRLFTFGCSFTNYKWPTWADIIGKEFEEYYNYGMSGGGNMFIFSSLVEAITRHQISDRDLVIIMWTNVMRDDRYSEKHGGWLRYGNLYTARDYLDSKFIDKYVTIRGSYIRDLSFISASKKLLEGINCDYRFLSMVDIENQDQYSDERSPDVDDVLLFYKDAIDTIKPSIYKTIFKYDWNLYGKRNDPHPLPKEHLAYVYEVLPDITITEKTVQWVSEVDAILSGGATEIYNYPYERKDRL